MVNLAGIVSTLTKIEMPSIPPGCHNRLHFEINRFFIPHCFTTKSPPPARQPEMFTKLQRDAAHIDMGIRSLQSKMAAVMTGYTRNNPDAAEALAGRQTDAERMSNEMRAFLADMATFEELLNEIDQDGVEIEETLEKLAVEHELVECSKAAMVAGSDGCADGDGHVDEVDKVSTSEVTLDEDGTREESVGTEESGSCNGKYYWAQNNV